MLDVPPASYLDTPGLDAVKIAEAYGITAQRIEDLAELTDVVEAGMAATGPRLVEVPQADDGEPDPPGAAALLTPLRPLEEELGDLVADRGRASTGP